MSDLGPLETGIVAALLFGGEYFTPNYQQRRLELRGENEASTFEDHSKAVLSLNEVCITTSPSIGPHD